ncbi:hypothetical protein AYI70_g2877 [Smittium culicis]|uniref:Uncharacterized protein n=1 Tax=Smittium culicis TaxID=133412 RepID=A0A1R1XA56_9FUNG|nr:hypothetical protein AYI70_g9673 [Smittium culicis]OMJ22429.1 hypothetical protein AYI70_g2877 [Smittium culicis]
MHKSLGIQPDRGWDYNIKETIRKRIAVFQHLQASLSSPSTNRKPSINGYSQRHPFMGLIVLDSLQLKSLFSDQKFRSQ